MKLLLRQNYCLLKQNGTMLFTQSTAHHCPQCTLIFMGCFADEGLIFEIDPFLDNFEIVEVLLKQVAGHCSLFRAVISWDSTANVGKLHIGVFSNILNWFCNVRSSIVALENHLVVNFSKLCSFSSNAVFNLMSCFQYRPPVIVSPGLSTS